MKKVLIALGIVAILTVVSVGTLALYIYKLDLGVGYKGRARLDYNWKYHFAACPKDSYLFDGKLFAFSYPSFAPQNPMHEYDGWIGFDDNMWDIIWDNKIPPLIKSELSGHLLYEGAALPAFSSEFMQWIILESDAAYLDSSKTYNIKQEKIEFKKGGSAILISLQSKTEQRPYRKYVIGMAPGGDVFKVRNLVRLNASESSYRNLMFKPFHLGTVYPDPARDARSACALNRLLETFEYKR